LLNPLQHPCAHLAQAAASPPYRHWVPDPAVHGFTLPKCTAFFPSRCPYLLVTEAKWQFPSFPFPHHSSPLFCSHSHCSAVPCQATMSPSELLSHHPCVSSDSRAERLELAHPFLFEIHRPDQWLKPRWRERTLLQIYNKTKPKQLKLSKSYPSMWP
jgi:hypothetical protein